MGVGDRSPSISPRWNAATRDIDLCALLPHAAVRVFVMGERAVALENANQADIAQMREIAADAMRAGAFGFSTSRSLSHKSLKGDPTPTLRAQEDELTGIAMGMRDAGSGFLEIVSEWAPDPKAEFAMIRRVVEACGRPCVFTLTQRHARPTVWRDLLGYADEAIAARRADPPGGGAARRSACCSGWRAARTRSPARRPTSRSRICRWPSACGACAIRSSARADAVRGPEEGQHLPAVPSAVVRRRCSASAIRRTTSRSARIQLAAIAEREGRTPQEVAYDVLLEDDGNAFIYTPLGNYADYDLSVQRDDAGESQHASWAWATAARMSRSFWMPATRPGC